MTEALTINASIGSEGRVLLALTGELDMATASVLDQAVIEAATGSGVARLTLDLGDLAFVDSSGLAAFLRAQDLCNTAACVLVLRDPSRTLRQLLEITSLTDHFTVEVAEGSSMDLAE